MQYLYSTTPAATAAHTLQRTLERYADVPVLLLVSGGSWFSVLDLLPAHLCSIQLTLGVLDERYDENPANNNFAQLMRTTFFATASACGVSVIDTRVRAGETAEALATRFEATIRSWQKDFPTGVIVVTLGMGEDGHTAGIMPGYVTKLQNTEAFVQAYTVPADVNPFPHRVTTTPQFLTTVVTEAVAYVAGPAKCTPLANVEAAVAATDHVPAGLWQEMASVTVVTDCAQVVK